MILPTGSDVLAAAERLRGVAHETAVLTSRTLDRLVGCEVFFKCENLQKTGAFKARGAANAVLSSPDDVIGCGVATHSSGNHGAALAWAASLRGVPAYVVVPDNASAFKREAIARYGAEVIHCGPALADREAMLEAVVQRTGAHVIPPYDDARIIAGQGTAALELMRQVPDLDAVWVPVGGGGMVSGAILAASAMDSQSVSVFGAEPELAGEAAVSMRTGVRQPQMPPVSIADGLRTSLGALNFRICLDYGLQITLVSEAEICAARDELMQILKLMVEPSSAVPWAAVRKSKLSGRIGIIISGGNCAVGN